MSTPSLTKRTWAFLASATIGLSGVAGVPAAFATETNSHISAGEVTAASEQSLQDVTVPGTDRRHHQRRRLLPLHLRRRHRSQRRILGHLHRLLDSLHRTPRSAGSHHLRPLRHH